MIFLHEILDGNQKILSLYSSTNISKLFSELNIIDNGFEYFDSSVVKLWDECTSSLGKVDSLALLYLQQMCCRRITSRFTSLKSRNCFCTSC